MAGVADSGFDESLEDVVLALLPGSRVPQGDHLVSVRIGGGHCPVAEVVVGEEPGFCAGGVCFIEHGFQQGGGDRAQGPADRDDPVALPAEGDAAAGAGFFFPGQDPVGVEAVPHDQGQVGDVLDRVDPGVLHQARLCGVEVVGVGHTAHIIQGPQDHCR